ncbi:hypothetical protein [Nocardia sp. NPDC051570]|uniref:hypothetical protein n=1 Tax=Nocardia sp. NPDC051570 TaxID=3364324 RepID=UPI0037ACBCFE
MTAPTTPSIDRIARTEGLAPALRLLLAPEGGRVRTPSGYAVLPEDGVGDGATVRRRYELPGGAVLLVHDSHVAGDDAGIDQLALVRLRLGLAEGLRDACLTYLSTRPSGDGTVLAHQMVKGQLAELFSHQLEVGALLDSGPACPGPAVLSHLHAEVTATSRALLRLFGAYSFLDSGPGATAHVSELVADVYLCAGGPR